MIVKHTNTTTPRVILTTTIAILALTFVAVNANAGIPTKLVFTGAFGRHVNLTQVNLHSGPVLEDICGAPSGIPVDTCQRGEQSAVAGGFTYPYSVAVASPVPPAMVGNVYVADDNNARVQELTPTGEFVLMFGWKVNKKGGNLCTKAEENECRAGEEGTGLSEQISGPQDVAVDPSTGNIYVAELYYKRIEEFTPEGKFILMIGGNVDKTKVDAAGTEAERNLCTAASKDVCQAGEFAPHALRNYMDQGAGDLLVVGGPENLLYVGDEQRVQEFKTDGEYERELSLTSISTEHESFVRALAVTGSGDVYVVEHNNSAKLASVVHEFNTNDEQVEEFATPDEVLALALDPFGRLAIHEQSSGSLLYAVLYSGTGERLGTFTSPYGTAGTNGFAFNSTGELYAADGGNQTVELYEPAAVAELVTSSAEHVTVNGATLDGEVNPEGVKAGDALVWFAYGPCGGAVSDTPVVNMGDGTAFLGVRATLENLLPNEKYCYTFSAEDSHDRTPEPPLVGKILSFSTPPVAPVVGNAPSVFDVTFSSAVLSGTVDPENANTRYVFQYAAFREHECETLSSCGKVLESAALESSVYKTLGSVQTISELAPSTRYLARVYAVNEHSEQTGGQETEFTTAPGPSPTATTGPAGNVGVTGAILTGTTDPGGAGATYSFQAGIDKGTDTVYGIVSSGPLAAQAAQTGVSFELTGLQAGIAYAYRLVVSSAYGESVGQPVVFTTLGLATVLFAPPVLAELPIPSIVFPAEPNEIKPKTLTQRQRLANALKACARKPKKQRKGCERTARKKYVKKSKKK